MAHPLLPALIPSRFLVTLTKGGLVALVHQLRPEPVYLRQEDWEQGWQKLPPETVAILAARELLVADPEIDERTRTAVRLETERSLDRPTILYLMLAQGCNYACRQCPIPGLAAHYGEHLLTFEAAVAGIRLWQSHLEDWPDDNDPYFLIFYGGEPLLNAEVLERLLVYVAAEKRFGRLHRNVQLMLVTNGSLLDERLAKQLAAHNVLVAIGLDGPPEHNDQQRITAHGDPTYAQIERAIHLLLNSGVRTVASVACTPTNVDSLAEYPAFLQGLGLAQYGLNIMKGQALIRELAGRDVTAYIEAAARGVLAGLGHTQDTGQPYEYQLQKKLDALQNGRPFAVDCTCYGNQLVIQADGQVTNCPFRRCDQGHVADLPPDFRIQHTAVVQRWRTRHPLLNDSVLATCHGLLDGGGCAWSSYELTGDETSRDVHNARFTEEVMHELIWRVLPFEQAGALRSGATDHWDYRRVGDLHHPEPSRHRGQNG